MGAYRLRPCRHGGRGTQSCSAAPDPAPSPDPFCCSHCRPSAFPRRGAVRPRRRSRGAVARRGPGVMCVRAETVRAWMGGCWPATNGVGDQGARKRPVGRRDGRKCPRCTRVFLELPGGQLPGLVLSMRRSYSSSARRSASISSAASRALIGTMSSDCSSIGRGGPAYLSGRIGHAESSGFGLARGKRPVWWPCAGPSQPLRTAGRWAHVAVGSLRLPDVSAGSAADSARTGGWLVGLSSRGAPRSSRSLPPVRDVAQVLGTRLRTLCRS